MPRTHIRRFFPIAFAVSCAVMVAGCATWQGPRIDPTGERFFVWPGDPPPIVAPPITFAPGPVVAPPPPGATVIAPPAGATVVAPPPAAAVMQPLPQVVPSSPFGNVMAPPVYSDPPGMIATTPFVGPATPVPTVPAAPPGAPLPPLPAPPIAAAPALPPPPPIGAPIMAPPTPAVPAGCEHLQVRPNGLIAPVGSEMILKGSICSGQGHMVANQRVDWCIACNGVGQFTELGFRDFGQLLGWWERPRKIDDRSATSNTAMIPITLNTNTPDPNDDVPIERGEAWVTVTSAQEGISVVTATAPNLCQYNQAHSTIYWINAQWVFPQPAVVQPGCPHTLTTTLMRRTDGAPLCGWVVRYDVGGGAALGYEGGSATEVTTDVAGRASVEVSPKDPGGGATNVCVTIIRPQNVGPAAMPRLELGRGGTTITWSAAPPVPVAPGIPAAPGVPVTPGATGIPIPPPPLPAPPSTPFPPPSLPPTTTQPASPPATAPPAAAPATPPDPYRPPAAATTGKPKLEVSLRPAGPDQVSVGEYAGFDLTVTNRGDGVANNVRVSDRYDRGLKHPSASTNDRPVEYSFQRALAPNESDNVRLTFQVIDVGKQCHEATVTADGADPVVQTACVTARQAALEVTITGLRSRVVGDVADFKATVKNIGDVDATNIELVVRIDEAIKLTMADAGSQSLANNGVMLKIDRLIPTERRELRLQGECRLPSNKACALASVTADGGVSQAAEACVEILPPNPNAAPGAAAGPQANSNLRLTIKLNRNLTSVNDKQPITVTVENAGQQTERQVATRVLLPAELTPDPTQIQPQSEVTVIGNEIRFAPIAEFTPGQQKQYVIPVTAVRAGRVKVTAQIAVGQVTSSPVESEPIDIQSGSS